MFCTVLLEKTFYRQCQKEILMQQIFLDWVHCSWKYHQSSPSSFECSLNLQVYFENSLWNSDRLELVNWQLRWQSILINIWNQNLLDPLIRSKPFLLSHLNMSSSKFNNINNKYNEVIHINK